MIAGRTGNMTLPTLAVVAVSRSMPGWVRNYVPRDLVALSGHSKGANAYS